MFNKLSRYYSVENIVTPDPSGHRWESKRLRSLPGLKTRFEHTIEASDRLDQLAYKYYKQSRHWWRICDANPEFHSPLDLLGQSPTTYLAVEVGWQGEAPPWYRLFQTLEQMLGMESIIKGSGVTEMHHEQTPGPPLFELAGTLRNSLNQAVLTQVLPDSLAAALLAQSVTIDEPVRVRKPGEQLWQLRSLASGASYFFNYNEGDDQLAVLESVSRHQWLVILVYNRQTLGQEAIFNAIEDQGFSVISAALKERAGKALRIPPRYQRVRL